MMHEPQKVYISKSDTRISKLAFSHIRGTDVHSDIGLDIYIEDGKEVHIDVLIIDYVFVGIIKTGNGLLKINELTISNFGGDSINIRGSNVEIGSLTVSDNTPVRPYNTLHVTKEIHDDSDKLKKVLYAIDEDLHNPKGMMVVDADNQPTGWYEYLSYHADVGFHSYSCRNETNTEESIPMLDGYDRVISSREISHIANLYMNKESDLDFLTARKKVLELVLATPHKLNYSFLDKREVNSISIPSSSEALIFDDGLKQFEYQYDHGIMMERDSVLSNEHCKVEHVHIDSVDIHTSNRLSQVFVLSDKNAFIDFKIGSTKLVITCVFQKWLIADSLYDSKLGNNNNVELKCIKPTKPEDPMIDFDISGKYFYEKKNTSTQCREYEGGTHPSLRGIGIDIKDGSDTPVDTTDVTLIGIEEKAFDGIPADGSVTYT